MLHRRISLIIACLAASAFGVAVADEPEHVATDDALPQVPAPPDPNATNPNAPNPAAEDPAEVASPATDPDEGNEPGDEPEFPETTYEPVAADVVEKWIADLGDPSYEIRESARERLIAAGPQVLPAIVRATEGDNLEVSVRAVAIFERLYERVGKSNVEVVEDTLDALLESENASTSMRAKSIAESAYELREERALNRIVELGGVVERVEEPTVIGGRVVFQPTRNGEGAVGSVRLDPATWKGGDDGLKYVKRLTGLARLYLVQGVVSDKAQADLQAALPALDIQGRGKAYLGIGGSAGIGGGCFVTVVRPGTAAAKAGLQPGDRIDSFGGEVVQGFPHLVDLIAKHGPGETVTAKVLRNGVTPVDVEITLGRWSDDKPSTRPVQGIPPVPVPPRPVPDRD